MKPLALAALVASAVAAPAMAETYTIDTRHTQVMFTYSRFGYSNITGRFDNVEGEIVYDAADPTAASIKVTVPIATVSSGVEAMDEHFRKDDLFDATKFPTATFQSTSVASAGEGKLRVSGDLTIHGVTKSTDFDVTINNVGVHPNGGKPAAGFDAVGKIKRSDFGVDKYVPNIADEVTLRITTEALAKSAD
jgi:polyisoprenoid-binding protein YceI